MGKLFSKCWKSRKLNDSYQRMSDVFPFPFKETDTTPLDKNDTKFYFLKNEKQIDSNINYLHDKYELSAADLALLEQTLAELKQLKQRYTVKPSYDILDRMVIASEQNFDDGQQNEPNFPLKHGTLLIEIQDANFLHLDILNQQKFRNPYVVAKIYLSSNKKSYVSNVEAVPLTEVQKFQSLKGINSQKPQWNELFEYDIEDNDKISMYSFSFALYYSSDNMDVQIGDEQIFNINPLLDQRVQTKTIELKDPIEKGTLAKLRVRLQLLLDVEEIRAKISRDIRVRIENLVEIKERHGGLVGGRDDHDSTINSARLSEAGSLISKSSAHDNEDNLYFVS